MRVGVVGSGWIAEKAAITLNGLGTCRCYAIASRTKEKAEAFAKEWGVPKAYGSYAELYADPDVDLVYVATPHSHHYEVTRDALKTMSRGEGFHGKPRPVGSHCEVG